jgi:MYXO-CTERM domain-containing protein
LRSGLALAGANTRSSGGEDGVLTALEAAGMDLRGTKLVVLSACETGLGEVRDGEGIYGLRRALVIAGAEAIMMSLWKVDDEATRGLMEDYYARLKSGSGRSEALREVQIAMLSGGTRFAHPHYWASFIVSGDGSPLTPAAFGSRAGEVRPGPRGCACALAGEGAGGAREGLLAALFGIIVSRRRRRRAARSLHKAAW